MKITIKRTRAAEPRARAQKEHRAFYAAGMWASVVSARADKNTADVVLEDGAGLSGVPVASREWVTKADGAPHTGERRLPPKGARVFVFMPEGGYDGAFIAPFSGYPDGPLPALAEEGAEGVDKTLSGGGWEAERARDGSFIRLAHKEGGAEIELKPEGALKAVLGGAVLEISASGAASLKTASLAVEASEGVTVETGGDLTAKAGGSVTVEAAGEVVLKTGDAAAWFPNTMPACPFGMVHGGAGAGVAKLKGA